MKVVLIGGGIISDRLAASQQAPSRSSRFGIRHLSTEGGPWENMLNECLEADLIVYLAYHHRNLLLNVLVLEKLLRRLKLKGWHGRLAFFNTQSVLIGKIMHGPNPLPAILRYDPYTITKRIQSWIIRRYSRAIDICEIFLPVVVGEGTKSQDGFRFIAAHPVVNMPMRAKHLFAYLDLDDFVRWFWERFAEARSGANGSVRSEQLFVYQGTRTFSDMIESMRSGSESTPMNIRECNHKYRFDGSVRSNFIWHLKLSPVGLFMGIIKNAIKNDQANKTVPQSAARNQAIYPGEQFVPTGAEYQFYSTSIDLNAVPFRKEKVD